MPEQFSTEGAVSGAASGAGAGAFAGPWAALAGGIFGGLAGGFGGRKRRSPPQINIQAELARIEAIYAKAGQAAIANIKREAGQARRATASNLAARGIYTSPVSENSFGALNEAMLASIGQAEGQIAGESASMQAQILQSLAAQQQAQEYQEYQRREQARASMFAALGGLGTNLFVGALSRPATKRPGGGFMPTGGPNPINPRGGPLNAQGVPTTQFFFGGGPVGRNPNTISGRPYLGF